MQQSTMLSSESVAHLATVLAATHRTTPTVPGIAADMQPATQDEQAKVASRLTSLRQQLAAHRLPAEDNRLEATRRAVAAESTGEREPAKTIFIGIILPQ